MSQYLRAKQWLYPATVLPHPTPRHALWAWRPSVCMMSLLIPYIRPLAVCGLFPSLPNAFPFASTPSSSTTTSEQPLGATSNEQRATETRRRCMRRARTRPGPGCTEHSVVPSAGIAISAFQLARVSSNQFELCFPLRVRPHVPPKLSPRLDSLGSRHRGFSHRLRLPASAAKRRRDVSGSIDCVFTVRIQTVLVGGARAVRGEGCIHDVMARLVKVSSAVFRMSCISDDWR